MRAVVCVIGGLLGIGALALAALRCSPVAAGMLGFWAFVLFAGLAIERWRYKKLAPPPPLGRGWQRTDERFVDPETGKLVTVYFHPATGERRYVAA